MPRIDQETIDRVRHSADIVEVISKYVDLKKRGRNYFGLCPFHAERTPSFSVAPDKEIYHCFGCGAGGSVINFIMEKDKLSFVEAVQQLAKDLGIEVTIGGESGSKQLFTQLYEQHDTAAKLYADTLFSRQGEAAFKYLMGRGLTEETLRVFQLGFAPDNWEFLTQQVKGKGFSQESVTKSGLFIKGKQGFADRFRSRIMFPIMNRSGRIIAFGGRVFGIEDPAKYLNSPETPLYKKSEVFYGYHKTAGEIRNSGQAVLVEGYMDFLQLYQAGFANVLAVSGTAFTARHALQIGKIAEKVVLMYDGDKAGQNASVRAGYALLQNGIAAGIVKTPAGIDPDEWVKTAGKATIDKAVQSAMSVLDFHLEITGALALPAVERANLVKEILREVADIKDSIIRNDLLKNLAGKLKISEEDLLQQFRNSVSRKKQSPDPRVQMPQGATGFTSVLQKAQLEIIRTLALHFQEVQETVRNQLAMITDPLLNRTAELLLKLGPDSFSAVLEALPDKTERETIGRILMEEHNIDDPQTVVQECLSTLIAHQLKEKIKATRIKIREMEATGQDSSALVKVVDQLQLQLRTVSQSN